MYGSIRRTALASTSAIKADLRKFRFRLVDFLVNMCEENALARRMRPPPVALNRLAAPLLVFIFGMVYAPYIFTDREKGRSAWLVKYLFVLSGFRTNKHHELPTFHLWFLNDHTVFTQGVGDLG